MADWSFNSVAGPSATSGETRIRSRTTAGERRLICSSERTLSLKALSRRIAGSCSLLHFLTSTAGSGAQDFPAHRSTACISNLRKKSSASRRQLRAELRFQGRLHGVQASGRKGAIRERCLQNGERVNAPIADRPGLFMTELAFAFDKSIERQQKREAVTTEALILLPICSLDSDVKRRLTLTD